MKITGTIQLSPLINDDHVSSRLNTVTINGVAIPVIEGLNGAPQFTCNEGDTIEAVDSDVNSNSAVSSDPYTVVAQLPQGPPTKPTIQKIVFSK